MEKIIKVQQLIREELIMLEKKVGQINEIIRLLKNEVDIPVQTNSGLTKVKESEYELQLKEIFRNYPVEGKQRDKIRFILSTYGRAISDAEFEEVIKILEGIKAAETLKVYQRTVRGLTHPRDGEILQFNFVNSKIRFYAKADWINSEKNCIITDRLPKPSEINSLQPDLLVNPRVLIKKVQ